MTRGDLQKLIGGYATGSLTDAERKMLFEAALEDQDLFDELAREQALKEILDQPGAKQRLAAALARSASEAAWWRRPLVWSLAGAVAVAVVALSWIIEKRSQITQVARLRSAPPVVVSAPEKKDAPAAPVSAKKQPVRPLRDSRAYSDRSEPAAEHDEKGSPAKTVESKAEETRNAPQKDVALAAPFAPPSPAQERSRSNQRQASGQVTAAPPPGQSQAPIAPQQGQSASGTVGGLAPAFRRAAPASAPARPFAFEYALEDQELVLKFASEGYFSIHFSPGLDTIVASHVAAGTTRRERIPNNATEAAIVFSADPQAAGGGVTLIRENRTGAVDDPSRTRIELLLRFYP